MNIESSSTHASPVSLPDVPHVSAPPLDISHYVTEDLVPVPTSTGVPTSVDSNAPPALDTATPARIGFLSRLFGSNGQRQQPEEESYITDRRRAVGPGAVSASPSEDQRLLQLQISAEATEQRLIAGGNPRGPGSRGGAPPGPTHGTRERHGKTPSAVLRHTEMP